MAKKITINGSNLLTDVNQPWGGVNNTQSPQEIYGTTVPAGAEWGVNRGEVERFLKKTFNSKAGEFYYDMESKKYLVFADAESRDLYLSDSEEYAPLLLASFDAPLNYTAEIVMQTPPNNVILNGSTDNYIDFTFDITNKSGASTGESVVADITFSNSGNIKRVTQVYNAGTAVHLLIDDYLEEGLNNISVSITGKTTLASTMVSVIFSVVSLQFSSSYDFSKGVANGNFLSIPYTLEGAGLKYIEWYIDGVMLQNVDTITDIRVNRTKSINVSSLAAGKHNVQARAYLTERGRNFYSKTLYYDFVVEPATWSDNVTYVLLGLLLDEPTDTAPSLSVIQYKTLNYDIAVYDNRSRTLILQVLDNGSAIQSLSVVPSEIMSREYTPTAVGVHTLSFSADGATASLIANVTENDVNISEETDALLLKLSAKGRSNYETTPATWVYGAYSTTFNNFAWNERSGWNDNALVIPAGSSIDINFALLGGNPITKGRTIEIEYETSDIVDDEAPIISLTNTNTGAGLQVTASSARLQSSGGANVNTKYKDGDRIHLAFIINKTTGDDARLIFIVNNGIAERAAAFQATDSFSVSDNLHIGSNNCTVKLRSIRVYDKALPVDSAFGNFAIDQDNLTQIANNNDIFNSRTGLIDADKVNARVPIMIITGDMQPIFDTTDKNTTVYVDLEYRNLQDQTKNFTATHVRMRPQGTSSLGYPRKNLRPYTSSKYGCVMRDAAGEIIEDGLYAFKDGSQPVNCWTLKADYAESSGSHNTGVARLWNDILYRAQLDGNFAFRTEAQKAALASNFGYDVRTTIDGFPIVVFYHRTEEEPLTCLGQYNFNNDKSTESVFGFKGIPNFDNSHVQCFEFLANENPICLFDDVSNFNSGWSDAFESRYPDTKTPNLIPLRNLATWINSCKNNQQKWNSEKSNHFDLPKLAAYYVYLMRFGAVDQPVKNAMIMTEDGTHWFFINYDNDTVLGIDNISTVLNAWNYDRSTQKAGGAYYFAGHNSVLWNCFEADPECMTLVSEVDMALYGAGLTYANMIRMFDEEQCDKWCERLYNDNGRYKYIQPYQEMGSAVLYMLQGSRKSYRHWWLQHRMDLYDAKWASGAFRSRVVRFIAEGAQGGTFSVTSATNTYYGYGINSVAQETGVYVAANTSHDFTISQTLAIGDPVSIYNANNAVEIDLSGFAQKLTTLYINQAVGNDGKSSLKRLILGDGVTENVVFTQIGGLASIPTLEEIDIRYFTSMTSIELGAHTNLHKLLAENSGLTSFAPAAGVTLTEVSLPSTIQSITLNNADVTALTCTPTSALRNISLTGVTGSWDAGSFVASWLNVLTDEQIAAATATFTGINWTGWLPADVIKLLNIGDLTIRGTITLSTLTFEDYYAIVDLAGESVFHAGNSLFINSPSLTSFEIDKSSMKAGNTANLLFVNVPVYEDAIIGYEMYHSGTKVTPVEGVATYGNVSLNVTTGQITSTLAAPSDTFSFRASYTRNGITTYTIMKSLSVVAISYPTSVSISGAGSLVALGTTGYDYTKSFDTNNFNADIISVSWILSDETYTSIDSQSASGATLDYERVPSVSTNVILSCTVLFEGGVELTGTKTISQSVVPITSFKILGSTISEAGSHTFTFSSFTPAVYNAGIVAASASISPAVAGVSVTCTTSGVTITNASMPAETTTTVLTVVATIANGDTVTQTRDVVIGEVYGFELVYKRRENNRDYIIITNGSGTFTNFAGATLDGEPIDISREGSWRTPIYDDNEHLVVLYYSRRITTIGYSFLSSDDLRKIFIPDTVESIEDNAFRGYGLHIYISKSVTSIEAPIIEYWGSVSHIDVSSENQTFYSPEGSNAIIKTSTNELVMGCGNTTIPSNVTSIGTYAFYRCSSLASVTIPSGVTRIDDYAFSDCSSLTSVTIPSSVTIMGDDAFARCSSLTSVTIPSSVTRIGSYAFYHCYNLTSITIPSGVTSIGYNAFANCSSLTSVTIPSSVTSMGYRVFESTNLKTAGAIGSDCDIEFGWTNIPNNAFAYSPLTSITIPSGVTSIGSDVFSGCSSLASIIVDSNNQTFYSPEGSNAIIETSTNKLVMGCNNTTIPSGVTSIGYSAFANCSSLTSVTIPDSVTSIGSRAFSYCTSLTSITIPDSVTSIGSRAFEYCGGLTSITIPDSVTSIGGEVFYRCSSLSSVIIFSNIGNAMFVYCTSLTSVTIGSGVTSIDERAFGDCTSLTSITIPDSVTTINRAAFGGCTSLTSVTFGSGVTSIAESLFSQCTSLTSITIPDSVTSIGNYAFSDCSSLTSITIGSGVRSISYQAFRYCNNLTSIISLPATAPSISSSTFENIGSSATGSKTLTVPANSTGYDAGYWQSTVVDEGYTLNKTL